MIRGQHQGLPRRNDALIAATTRYDVDVRDILTECGTRRLVGG